MKLYNFLNETKYFKNLKLEQCVDLIKQNCTQNWKYYKSSNFEGIWRGDRNGPTDIGLFEGNTTRKSANTSNYYTILFSKLLPSWNQLPKRNKSIICSLDESASHKYGSVYFILPYDNINMGYSNVKDFWDIIWGKKEFRYLRHLLAFNEVLFDDLNISSTKLKSIVNMKIDKFIDKYKEYDSFKHWLYLFDLNINKISSQNEYIKHLEKIREKYKDVKLLDFLDKILDPKGLDIKTKKYNQLKTEDIEVWTEGPALLIRKDILDDLVDII